MLHSSQAHRGGPLAAEMRRSHPHRQLLPPGGKPQMGAITAEPQRAGAAFQLLLQFAQGQGLILAQAGQAAVFALEQGGIHLPAAGVHHGDNGPLKAQQAIGDGLRGGNADAGGVIGEGQPLDGGDADAQPGKAAGAGIDAVEVDVLAACLLYTSPSPRD